MEKSCLYIDSPRSTVVVDMYFKNSEARLYQYIGMNGLDARRVSSVQSDRTPPVSWDVKSTGGATRPRGDHHPGMCL